MKRKEEKRTRMLFTYLAPAEYEKVFKEYKNSTCRDLSSYLRKLILAQAIHVFYRDQRLAELIVLLAHNKKILEELVERPGRNEVDQKRLTQVMDEFKEINIKLSDHVCKIEISQKRRKGGSLS